MFTYAFSKSTAGNFPSSAIQFIENKGQWEPNILFRAELPIGSLFIERNQLTYLFVDKIATHKKQHGEPLKSIHFHSVKVKLLGSNLNPTISKDYKSKEYYNYFVGEEKNWASNVFAYKKIILHNVYPSTDLELLAQPDGLKINFIMAAGADPTCIKLEYKGADKLDIVNNQLHIKTSMGEWVEEAPVSYQDLDKIQEVIKTDYVLNNNIVAFKLDHYNKKAPLIIDPSVIFGTYMGSAADNFGFAASYDAYGNAYGAGTVYEANFPITTGAYDIYYGGGNGDNGEYARDAFIAKFNPLGSQLIFATFLGGSDNEQPHSVSVMPDSSGPMSVVIMGTTHSTDFPTTPGAFDRTHNGKADIFICKLNSAGNTLIASTFYGGSENDGINGNAVYSYASQSTPLPYNYADCYRGEVIYDKSQNIVVSSCTQSQGIPLVNPAQGFYGGGIQDGILLKFSNSLSSLMFSTFVGGNGDDAVYSVGVNNINELIVGGGTTSSNMLFANTSFPYNSGVDGFLGKYSSSGQKLKIIYTGTSSYDQIYLVQTDNQNNIYTLGQTAGSMSMSAGVYGKTNGKQFLQKYDPNLNAILLKTVFGNGNAQPEISPTAFLVDNCGRVYVSGWGGGTNTSYHNGMSLVYGLPTTSDAFQKTTDGSDFYLMVLSQNFGQLLYATFYGGGQSQEHVDGGTSHFDKSGIVYQAVCAGCGGLSDFPTTPTAYSRINPGKRAFNHNLGGCNLGLFKFDMRPYQVSPVFSDSLAIVVVGQKLSFDFSATDANNDMITMTANSSLFYKSPNPATITDTVSVPGRISAHIEWQSICDDISLDTQYIFLEFNDNSCPLSNITKVTIKVIIISELVPPPYPDCIQIINDSSVQLKWTNNPQVGNFGQYMILRSDGGSNMYIYDSIKSQSTEYYYDLKALNNLSTNFCYQIVALNSCQVSGDSSRKICSIQAEDTSTAFIGVNDTLISLNPFDLVNSDFVISSIDSKDSVFLSVNGSFLSKGQYSVKNGLGSSTLHLSWQPGCDAIYKDTLYANIIARNNECPVWRMKTKIIKFYVSPLPRAPAPDLKCPRKFPNDSFQIDWTPFFPLKYTTHLCLIRVTNGIHTLILKTRELNRRSFTDVVNYDPTLSVYYYITSLDSCGYYGDTSATSSIQSNSFPAPELAFYTVTVQDNKELKLVWQKANPDSFWRYQIYKKEGRNNPSYSLLKISENINDTFMFDRDVRVDKESYCYQLVNTDLCGNKSKFNPPSCSILLEGKSFPFSHSLNWYPYDYWPLGINRYEVLKNEPGIYTEKLLTQTGEKNLFTKDEHLNYDNGLYQYTVVAYENIFGNNQNSRSNTVELIQAPILYVPNAYTENGDGLNDLFKTIPVFVKDYYLQIYNRWGELMFETRNKKAGFNSTFKNNEIQSDVYFYIVNYTGWDNSEHTLKGNFTILR